MTNYDFTNKKPQLLQNNQGCGGFNDIFSSNMQIFAI